MQSNIPATISQRHSGHDLAALANLRPIGDREGLNYEVEVWTPGRRAAELGRTRGEYRAARHTADIVLADNATLVLADNATLVLADKVTLFGSKTALFGSKTIIDIIDCANAGEADREEAGGL
jgi:hypothetical protein